MKRELIAAGLAVAATVSLSGCIKKPTDPNYDPDSGLNKTKRCATAPLDVPATEDSALTALNQAADAAQYTGQDEQSNQKLRDAAADIADAANKGPRGTKRRVRVCDHPNVEAGGFVVDDAVLVDASSADNQRGLGTLRTRADALTRAGLRKGIPSGGIQRRGPILARG